MIFVFLFLTYFTLCNKLEANFKSVVLNSNFGEETWSCWKVELNQNHIWRFSNQPLYTYTVSELPGVGNWENGHKVKRVYGWFCPIFFFFLKAYLLYFFLTLQYCIGFVILQHESTTGIHVFPIPNPPPSLYHPSGSSQCTSPKHPVSCIKPGLETHFIYDIIHVSMPFSFLNIFHSKLPDPTSAEPVDTGEFRVSWAKISVSQS